MKSIKVLAPLSQAALLLEMRSRENYPGRAERRLSARRRASLCETCREHRMGPPPPRVSRQSGGGLGGTDKEPRGAEVRGPCQAPRSEAVPELATRGGSDAGGFPGGTRWAWPWGPRNASPAPLPRGDAGLRAASACVRALPFKTRKWRRVMRHDKTEQQRTDVASPLTAAGGEATGEAGRGAGRGGWGVALGFSLLSKLAFMLNALITSF